MVAAGLATIPANLAGLGDVLSDPLGIGVGDLSDQRAAAADQAVAVTTLSLMATLFDGPLAAFSYLVFVLLYMPCVATLGAIYKEAGGFWAFFAASWNTLIAYGAAVLCDRLAPFRAPRGTGLTWLAAIAVAGGLGYAGLRGLAGRNRRNSGLIPVVNIRG